MLIYSKSMLSSDSFIVFVNSKVVLQSQLQVDLLLFDTKHVIKGEAGVHIINGT